MFRDDHIFHFGIFRGDCQGFFLGGSGCDNRLIVSDEVSPESFGSWYDARLRILGFEKIEGPQNERGRNNYNVAIKYLLAIDYRLWGRP